MDTQSLEAPTRAGDGVGIVISKLHLPLIALFGIALAVSISLSLLVGGLLLAIGFWRLFHRERVVRMSSERIELFLLAYVVWGILSAGVNQSVSLPQAISRQSAFLLFFLIGWTWRVEEFQHLISWFCGASIVVAGVGILQVLSPVKFYPDSGTYRFPHFFSGWPVEILRYISERNNRAVGTRSHPLTYAESFIPAFFALIVFARSWGRGLSGRVSRKGAGMWAAIGLLLAAIAFSQSRGVWLGIAIGGGVMIGMNRQLLKNRAVWALALLMPILIFSFSPLRGRFLSIFSDHLGTSGDQISKSTRFLLWKDSLQTMKENLLVGVGLEGAKLQLDRTSSSPRRWSEAHNIFFQAGVERGIMGLGLFVWILFLCGKRIWQCPSSWRGGFLSSFIAFVVAGLSESWTGDKEIAMIFWSMMGGVYLVSYRGRERTP